jgi:hypothetical protein
MLAVGVEPTTYRLQGGCSAIELCQHSKMCLLISALAYYHQDSCSSDVIFFPKSFDDREETDPGVTTLTLCLDRLVLFKQHFLYFNPEPHGHKSFLDILDI